MNYKATIMGPLLALALLPIAPQPGWSESAGTAQTSASAADRATTNLLDFDFLTAKIRDNYAGWDTKVTPATKGELDMLTTRLRDKAANASDDEFEAIAREWIAFFKDGHLQLGRLEAQKARVGATVATPMLNWTEDSIRARLASLGNKRDPVEGIWTIGDNRYRVGILRMATTPDRFSAAVIATTAENWLPGQIKAEVERGADGKLSMLYRRGDHGEEKVLASVVADGAALKIDGWGFWNRALPEVRDPDALARQFPANSMFLKKLSPTTLWLRLPDFDGSRLKPLEELLASHKTDLANTPNLLVDLRENGGGSDFVYNVVTPYLYTRPIYSIGVEMRASVDNLALRRKVADQIRKESPQLGAELDAQNVKMEQNLGRYFSPGERTFSIERLNTVLPMPKRVAVIIDGAASSGEQFLLEARQSRKVTMFGQSNSAGVLDFANMVSMELPSGRFGVAWATSRSMRIPGDPVDEGGIAPDIRIPTTEKDPVMFVKNWLERQRD